VLDTDIMTTTAIRPIGGFAAMMRGDADVKSGPTDWLFIQIDAAYVQGNHREYR